MRLMLDTNVALDFMLAREPYCAETNKLMLLGYLKEIELWLNGAQVNDLIYVLTKGGKPAKNEAAKLSLKKLRKCLHVFHPGEREFDAALDSTWPDLEDALLFQAALNLKADFIISRNQKDFALSSIRTLDVAEFFEHIEEHEGPIYELIDF